MNHSTATNGKAQLREQSGLKSNSTTARKFTGKSTLTEAQYHRLLEMLRANVELSTLDFRRAGIMAPSARIKELNDKHSYFIPTVARRGIYDEQGYRHRGVAFYQLVSEPEQGA